jgi:exodeoxyribonuclease-3
VKLVTWNVNSLVARMPRLLEFLETQAPDIACLQETKVAGDAFPAEELRAAGYEAVHHSAGRWAGVAILARAGLELRVASVYVTNGRAVGTPTFDEKLAFLDAMAARAGTLGAGRAPVVVAGDFNVAPADVDVYDPQEFVGSTHVTDEERGRLRAVLEAGGLVDAYRAVNGADEVGFTWWDYRQGHFHRKMGLRIDLALVSAELAPRLRHVGIVRDFRKGKKPSDHAPLVVELAD